MEQMKTVQTRSMYRWRTTRKKKSESITTTLPNICRWRTTSKKRNENMVNMRSNKIINNKLINDS